MDNIKSCGFIQMMEQRLENVFAEAQEKVEDSYGTLSVEVVFHLNWKTKFDKWLIFRGLITPFLWGLFCWIWIYSLFVFSNRFWTRIKLGIRWQSLWCMWCGMVALRWTVLCPAVSLTSSLPSWWDTFSSSPLWSSLSVSSSLCLPLDVALTCCTARIYMFMHIEMVVHVYFCLNPWDCFPWGRDLQFWLIQNTFSKDA